MVRLWHLSCTLLLLCKPGSSRAEAGAMELSGILGDSVTFPTGVPAEQFKAAAWTLNTANIIVTVGAGNPPTLIVSDPSYEGRLRVPAQSYSLQITGLRAEDTGTYRAQITTTTSIIYRHFTLRVYKPLAESDIKVVPVPGSVSIVNGTCSITLNCTVQGAGEDVNCTWAEAGAITFNSKGASIHISHRLGDALSSVTCTARNPVSNSSKSISLQQMCAATTPLYHVTSAPTTTISTASPSSFSILGPIFGIAAFILLIGLVVCCMWKKRRDKQNLTPGAAGSAGADGENHTVYAKVGNFPLDLTRKGTQNRGPQTMEETTKTIYSTVHLPSQPLQTDDEKLHMEGLGSMEMGEKTIYCTISQPSKPETSQPTKADDSVAARRTTEYDKIL